MESDSTARAYVTVEADRPRQRDGTTEHRRARRDREPGETQRRVGDYGRGVEGAPGGGGASAIAVTIHCPVPRCSVTTRSFCSVRPLGNFTGAEIDTLSETIRRRCRAVRFS